MSDEPLIGSAKVVAAILQGWVDDDLEGIEAALNKRRIDKAGENGKAGVICTDINYAQISPGDRVVLNGNAYPMHVRGITGTVLAQPRKGFGSRSSGKKAIVQVDDLSHITNSYGSRKSGETIAVPFGALTKIG